MPELSREEFLTHIALVRNDVQAVMQRLDVLNGRTRAAEQAIAVLEDRSGSGRAAMWGGGIAGLVVGAAKALEWIFGR